MSNLSSGKYAKFISDRSGQEFPYSEMVIEWNGARVHTSEFEKKHPQIEDEHLFYGLMEVDHNVVPFIFNKLDY